MPIAPTYPGVYVEELPSVVRTIVGVPTSIAAFVGWAPRGPDHPVQITNFGDYQAKFGGLHPKSPMSYAVYQFYQNGGSQAIIMRLAGGSTGADADKVDPAPATISLPSDGGGTLVLEALSVGVWGSALRARVDTDTRPPEGDEELYNLSIYDPVTGVETFPNISTDPDSPRSLEKVLSSSQLVRVKENPADDTTHREVLPKPQKDDVPAGQNPFLGDASKGWYVQAVDGQDGNWELESQDYLGGANSTYEKDKKGLYGLLLTDLFNILCLPGAQDADDVLTAALALCVGRRAMLMVDPPSDWTSLDSAQQAHALTGASTANAALYFPRINVADPLQDGRVRDFPPCGVMAGVWARTDAGPGVWKAPAGTDASLNGVSSLTVQLNDIENGILNPLAVNCLRSFPVLGPVSWGARTMRGADRLADQWKYVPVRRLALFIEESLYRGTQWVVFAPNDEPLWSSIRLNVGAFMNGLYRDGAFQGRTPRDAYLVKCDAQNNPQNDIDRGIVNILVGFAPLKPAEFVIIQIQQLAGQIQV